MEIINTQHEPKVLAIEDVLNFIELHPRPHERLSYEDLHPNQVEILDIIKAFIPSSEPVRFMIIRDLMWEKMQIVQRRLTWTLTAAWKAGLVRKFKRDRSYNPYYDGSIPYVQSKYYLLHGIESYVPPPWVFPPKPKRDPNYKGPGKPTLGVHAQITDEEVRHIRRLYEFEEMPVRKIMEIYDIGEAHLHSIVSYRARRAAGI